MLNWSQVLEKHIMLRTNAHELSHLLALFEHVKVKDTSCALSLLNQASQHRDCCRFTGTVLTEQSEDLILVYLQIYAFYSLETIFICLL